MTRKHIMSRFTDIAKHRAILSVEPEGDDSVLISFEGKVALRVTKKEAEALKKAKKLVIK